MKKILVSSALVLSVFCFLESPSAKAQESFFPDAYSQPVETVHGMHVGRRYHARTTFAPAPAVAARRRHIAHHIAH